VQIVKNIGKVIDTLSYYVTDLGIDIYDKKVVPYGHDYGCDK
jgi:hypothetical protein